MKNQDDVSEIIRLRANGLGTKRIAQSLGISRGTVKKYLKNGGSIKYKSPGRNSALSEHSDWVRENFFKHGGNADVVRQELKKEFGLDISLRTVEREVQAYREELRRESSATLRYETAPGEQMQIDFGEKYVLIDSKRERAHTFVAVLGYSRRAFVKVFRRENQAAWFEGMEEAFRYFGGVPRTVLVDNAAALVKSHNPVTGELVFNEKHKAFASYWGFIPKACKPRRARTKGKVERSVGYTKKNCIAGREFSSWEELEGHISAWLREISDNRELDFYDGKTPLELFEGQESRSLTRIEGRPPFQQIREYVRRVSRDSFVDIETNRYSVPWRYIGYEVRVQVGEAISICEGSTGAVLAVHCLKSGRHETVVLPGHLTGILSGRTEALPDSQELRVSVPPGELERPLSIYEEAVSA
jgi:transposase